MGTILEIWALQTGRRPEGAGEVAAPLHQIEPAEMLWDYD